MPEFTEFPIPRLDVADTTEAPVELTLTPAPWTIWEIAE